MTDKFTDGAIVAPLVRGPIALHHLVEWCAAENDYFHLHYDQDVARATNMPSPPIQGSYQFALMAAAVEQWVGEGGRLAEISARFKAPSFVGAILTAAGQVCFREEEAIALAVEVRDGSGTLLVEGSARVELGPASRPDSLPKCEPVLEASLDEVALRLVADQLARTDPVTVQVEASAVRNYLLALDLDANDTDRKPVPAFFLSTLGRVRRPHLNRARIGSVNAGTDFKFLAPVSLGDSITVTNALIGVERKASRTREMYLISTEQRYTRDDGALVGRRIGKLLRWP